LQFNFLKYENMKTNLTSTRRNFKSFISLVFSLLVFSTASFAQPKFTVNITKVDMPCFGSCEGSIEITGITGGCSPYTYDWSTGSTSSSIDKLCQGTYTVTVTDCKGDQDTRAYDINEPAELVASCTLVQTNSLLASAIGGTAPYSYLWSNGVTTAANNNLSAGMYTVTITDANGCFDGSSCEITKKDDCNGSFRTQTQGGWGQCQTTGNNPGTYLAAHFAAAFPNGLVIGACGKTITLNSVQGVCDFLPSGTKARALDASYINPGQTYRNVLAGQVAALSLSVGFDNHDVDFGNSATSLADQVVGSGTFAGWSVQDILDEANKVLGGCASNYSASALNGVVSAINENYVGGTINNGFLLCPDEEIFRIGTVTNSLDIYAYPNPFTNSITIKLASSASPMNVQIMDITGKVVLNAGVLADEITIGDNLSSGLYFIVAQDENGNQQKMKIVKQ
jgi:Secretion system C-terminal sorting domain/SprB repeat